MKSLEDILTELEARVEVLRSDRQLMANVEAKAAFDRAADIFPQGHRVIAGLREALASLDVTLQKFEARNTAELPN